MNQQALRKVGHGPGRTTRPARGVGEVLRAAREAAGMSQREVARRCHLSVETVSSVEAGREPRESTLARLLAHVPGLSAAELIGRPSTLPPARSAASWERSRDVHGYWARHVRVGPDLFEVRDLRPTEADLADEAVRVALLRAACLGTGDLLRRIEPDTRRLDDGEHVHEWAVDGQTVSYARRGPMEPAWTVHVPTLELRLGGGPAPCHVRVVSPVEGQTDLSGALHPRDDLDGSGTVCVDRPVVGLRYSLVRGRADRPFPVRELGPTLRAAREAGGVSLEGLGARTGYAASTFHYVEGGRSPRLNTLLAYVDEVPGLLPQHVLPEERAVGPWTPERAWEFERLLHGFVAEEIVKVVTVAEDGTARTRIETRGLSSTNGDVRELEYRRPALRTLAGNTSIAAQVLEAEGADLQVRRTRRWGDDGAENVLSWTRRGGHAGLSFQRRWESPRLYAASESVARERFGGAAPYYEGASLPIRHAVRRARLVVELPASIDPARAEPGCWTLGVLPDPELPPLSSELRPRLARVNRGEDGLRLTVSQDRPPVGTRLSLWWVVPADSD